MENKKPTNRQLQAINTQKKIYKSAMELINKNGFDNTTIEDISKKAQVSVGAFYHYYKSKEDIFLVLFKNADVYFKEEVLQHLSHKDVYDQILIFFSYYARYNNEQGLDAMRQLYTTRNKYFIAKGTYMHELLESIITDGFNSGGIFSDLSSQVLANDFFITARGVVFDWCLHDGDYNLEEKMIQNISHIATAIVTK